MGHFAGRVVDGSSATPVNAVKVCLMRAHAVWAVRRMGGDEQLRGLQAVESDVSVLAEYSGEV